MAQVTEHPFRTKRRKLDESATGANDVFNITAPGQLRELLASQQNAGIANRGILQFKAFLMSIENGRETEKAQRLEILKSYCDKQYTPAKEKEEQSICFPDIISTWNLGETSNHDHLLTNVPSVLAIFLKTISSELEFREFGLALCKFLLQKDQLKLVNRGLTSMKTKEHLISPCLRLLTEIVTFDGGAVAGQLYNRRHITFKRLELFLLHIKEQDDMENAPKKSTLRRNAVRYALANLRVQHTADKSDMLEQFNLTRALLDYPRQDSPDLVIDILKAIDRDIVQDPLLPRKSKSKFFNRWNLERLLTLYAYNRKSDDPNFAKISIPNEMHTLLMKICKDSSLGLVLSETGWYPVSTDPENLRVDDDNSIELGLDSPIYVDKFRDSVPVRNNTLSHIVQSLRIDSDTLQIELLMTIFKAAPELIADFFTKKAMFTADPKLTPTWMTESAFLFSTVQLPVPTNFGWKDKLPLLPPPVSIVVENILPRPLSQKTMTRCLHLNSDVINLFAVRILTQAFMKLRGVLKIFRADHGRSQLFWNQASAKLLSEFALRCPSIKDIILLFKRTAKEDLQQQEAVVELLSCYYQVMPDIALEDNFDVSLVLVDVLKRLEEPNIAADDSELLFSQLQSALQIAQQSTSMRWWQKPASMEYSPFTSILKVLVESSDPTSSRRFSILLRTILGENSILRNSPLSFNALISSLGDSEADLHTQLVFIDNCVCRVAKKPVHYLDLVGALSEDKDVALSPLVATVVEQWPFVVKAGNEANEKAVAVWIAKFFGHLKHGGECAEALKTARDALMEATETKKNRSIFKKCIKDTDDGNNDDKMDIDSDPAQLITSHEAETVDLDEIFGSFPIEGKTHNALHKWERQDLDAAVDQGHISELMLCLCSEHEEVRRQAFSSLVRFMAKLKESNYADWRSVYIVTGELLETVNSIGLDKPIPWIVGECASNCLSVLINPMHKAYGKVNEFLQKAPIWELKKIPSYWIDRILQNEPELDDGYSDEIDWMLGLFVKGLRSQADLEVYRRAHVFERILALYQSPTLTVAARRNILHIVYRAAQVGGSTTLITRAAIISWIQSQLPEADEKEASMLVALAKKLYETSDRKRIAAWGAGTLEKALEYISQQ
ncbi:hypothetical protein N7495_005925 [Penicillium taxi]|uniref:uncharacterized protein n=1 Tax=Penicillium taxi TaxID=168475 RepID=UPI0025457614|nr:uncharacterized protein N7495_005925 [Penicillium taxi]KAJ5894234.1 hypothetical protein N7495_005925 [Penicillium taxi]